MSQSSSIPLGLLIDATGVLYESVTGQDGLVIEGSIEAIIKLKKLGIPFKIISNASTKTSADQVKKLQRLGFPIREEDLISPIPMAKEYIRHHELRPKCFVGKGVKAYFEEVNFDENPDCVLLAFLDDDFNYKTVNEICQTLRKMDVPVLVTIGDGRYFKREKGIQLDIGSYASGITYTTDCKRIIIGKPTKEYFNVGVRALGLDVSQIVMIGDDPIGDIAGAQKHGIRAVQVMTGKYSPDLEGDVVPFRTLKNLKAAVDHFFP